MRGIQAAITSSLILGALTGSNTAIAGWTNYSFSARNYIRYISGDGTYQIPFITEELPLDTTGAVASVLGSTISYDIAQTPVGNPLVYYIASDRFSLTFDDDYTTPPPVGTFERLDYRFDGSANAEPSWNIGDYSIFSYADLHLQGTVGAGDSVSIDWYQSNFLLGVSQQWGLGPGDFDISFHKETAPLLLATFGGSSSYASTGYLAISILRGHGENGGYTSENGGGTSINGSQTGGAVVTIGVPEPTTPLMLIIGILAMLTRRARYSSLARCTGSYGAAKLRRLA